jgi:hypothetical protein
VSESAPTVEGFTTKSPARTRAFSAFATTGGVFCFC